MVLGDKYRYYLREVRKMKGDESITTDNVTYLTSENIKKTPEGIVLDNLRLNKMCCRRHILTHVDIE
jgi:DNA-directed RNA polymerase I, II, and III subunit RPABC5